jgi:hypothetical protein
MRAFPMPPARNLPQRTSAYSAPLFFLRKCEMRAFNRRFLFVDNFHDSPSDTFWRISSSCCPIPAEARFTCFVEALPSQTPVRTRIIHRT